MEGWEHREPSIGRGRGRFIVMVLMFVVPGGAFRLVIARNRTNENRPDQ